jgi:uncharacterized phage-associated protein
MRHEFDPDKAREVLTYVASKGEFDIYKTLKLVYLADKAHLERYGSLIFGDRYAALDYGPVASNAYDALKVARGDERASTRIPDIQSALSVVGQTLRVHRAPDLDYLSASDLECLDYAIEHFADLTFGELKALTHDDAYHATARNTFIRVEAIAATLPNGAEVVQHLTDPYPD